MAQQLQIADPMALNTWLWNLGTAGVVVAAAGCDPVAAGDTDNGTSGGTDSGTETSATTTPTPNTSSGPTQTSGTSYYGTSYYGTDSYGTSYYGTDSYGTDSSGDPGCEEDDDCESGICIDAGEPESYCELPIPDGCDGEVEVALTWVRQGEGAGTAAGLAGDDRVVLLDATVDADPVPVSLAAVEADATPEPLPVVLLEGETIVGAAGADVDGDDDEDVLLSVQDDTRLRVVTMLRQGDASFLEGESVTFESQGDPAQVRRFGDGSLELVSRLDSGLLFVAAGLGDGSFAAPVPSVWATEPLAAAAAVGGLDAWVDDDLAVAVAGPGGTSSIDVLIGGGELPVGAEGSDARSLHLDARGSWLITIFQYEDGLLELGRFQLGVDVDVNTLVFNEGISPLASTVSDVDGDGRSDLISLHGDGHLTVVFAASTNGACAATVETGAVFDSLHRPGAGERQGVVLSGPQGVLALRAAVD